jgi:peptidoglycan/xylan/chitin deacetylase (PgdA/CDA1 family)
LDALRSYPFPSTITASGIAPLERGVYREQQTHAGGVREIFVSLGDLMLLADLTGDGLDDVVVLLVESPGGEPLRLSLAVLTLTPTGLAVQATTSLGSDVLLDALSADGGDLLVYARRFTADDALCCPSIHTTMRLRLRAGQLAVVERSEVSRRVAAPLPELSAVPPIPLSLPQRVGQVRVDGIADPNAADAYQLRAEAGQTLAVAVESAGGAAFVGVIDPQGILLSAPAARARAWQGRVMTSGDYIFYVSADAQKEYTLQIDLTAPPAPQTPLTAQPTGERVVYLTFDDGPNPPYTDQIIELLARYDARATFFVLGRHIEAHPAQISALRAAGHVVANHTYSHPALAGIGREVFMREVVGTQNLLGATASRCFRPPYGSLDANTYAYAAELGLRVVLWDVDPQDWRSPGASVIAANVLANTRPGSIILLHDGGGARGQTVAALATILAELSGQGYRFAVLEC